MTIRRRQFLAVLALVALTLGAGCLGYITGGGEIDDATLDREPAEPYAFDTERDGLLVVTTEAEYRAVYNVSDREEVRLFRETGYGTEEPIELHALRVRYADGEVVNGSTFRSHGGEVEQTTDEVWVRFPADRDVVQLAFTAPSTPKRLVARIPVEGSIEVVLPPDRRVDFFLFGNVAPGGYETEVRGDRQHVVWDDFTGNQIIVQFYLQRDLGIFAVAFVVAAAIAVAGVYYYRRRIERLEEQRKEMGLDVEEEIDEYDDEDPPPGLR